MSKPTPQQMEHFYELQKQNIINRANLQAYLQNPNRFIVSFLTTVNRDLGLVKLVHAGVGPQNLGNINTNITPENFPITGTGIREVALEVQAYLDGETSEQAAVRLVADGYTLEGIAELAAFEEQYPEQVEKWAGWVLAINEASRWAGQDSNVCVPDAYVRGADRSFSLYDFEDQLDSDYGVLVSRPVSK